MRNIKTSCKALCMALALLFAASCAAPAARETPAQGTQEKRQKQVFAMDTVMLLTAYGDNAQAALDAAEQRIYELEADLDPESVSGSVYALNAGAGSQVVVSADCLAVMTTAMEYYFASGGALDPGLYPLSKAWGFIGGAYRVPERTEINALLAAKSTGNVRLDTAASAAELPAGMELSFGAVAKGYAAQAVIDLMRDMGADSAILSLGGNVQTLGECKPDGSQWQVAVTDPHDPGSYAGVLTVGEAAVVTSGGYRRYFVENGVTYIHILDPATGYPVDNDLLSVTVVTDDGAKADALSTTLFVLGKDGALEFYEQSGDFELVLITKDGQVIITPGLAESFAGTGGSYTYEYFG